MLPGWRASDQFESVLTGSKQSTHVYWHTIAITALLAPPPHPRLPPHTDSQNLRSLCPCLLQPLHRLAAGLASCSCLARRRSCGLLRSLEVCAREDGEDGVVCEGVAPQAVTPASAAVYSKLPCAGSCSFRKLLGYCWRWPRHATGLLPSLGPDDKTIGSLGLAVAAAAAGLLAGQQEEGDVSLHAADAPRNGLQLAHRPRIVAMARQTCSRGKAEGTWAPRVAVEARHAARQRQQHGAQGAPHFTYKL